MAHEERGAGTLRFDEVRISLSPTDVPGPQIDDLED
jgi:hypothetical protein